jgi:hypothetical protein
MYIALAEALEAPIVTCDAPLAKAPGHRAHVEVITWGARTAGIPSRHTENSLHERGIFNV